MPTSIINTPTTAGTLSINGNSYGVIGGVSGTTVPTWGATPSVAIPWEPDEMLRVRMRWYLTPFPCVKCHNHENIKALVFIVTKDGQHVVLEDEWAMFPSDRLVTQIRLLEQK